MKTVYARKGCAGFVRGESSDDERASFCARCKRNRTSHTRRLRIVDGGKNEEGTTMSAQSVSEAIETVPAERKAAVVDAMKVLLLAAPGAAIHAEVLDAEKWEQVKAVAHPSKVRLINCKGMRVCEAFICRVGDIVYNLSGPPFFPSRDEYNRMLDERGEDF
jgi:hypothetical protein